jgi:hypothetical protein
VSLRTTSSDELMGGPATHPCDLAELQRVMGHPSIRSTQICCERAEDLGAVERQQFMRSNWQRVATRGQIPDRL